MGGTHELWIEKSRMEQSWTEESWTREAELRNSIYRGTSRIILEEVIQKTAPPTNIRYTAVASISLLRLLLGAEMLILTRCIGASLPPEVVGNSCGCSCSHSKMNLSFLKPT